MELMSSLLFCAFVAMLPQSLGQSNVSDLYSFTKKNSTMNFLIKPSYLLQKKLLLNYNGPPLVNKDGNKESVFMDEACSKCRLCMERALQERKVDTKHVVSPPTSKQMHEELLTSNKHSLFKSGYRDKRGKPANTLATLNRMNEKFSRLMIADDIFVNNRLNTLSSMDYEEYIKIRDKREVETSSTDRTRKKSRSGKTGRNRMSNERKNKNIMSSVLSVTKYDANEKTYAIKIQEIIQTDLGLGVKEDDAVTCQVYKVVNTYACGSMESDSLIASIKEKNNRGKKKTKRQREKNYETEMVTTKKTKDNIYEKRYIIGQSSKENSMTSLEDIY